MSLLVDPQYFLHTLKLNYLRRLPDPIGPSSIGFTRASEEEAGPSHLNNPYIQLSGLADCQRWPELLVRGSPPEPFPVSNQHSNDQTPIRTRRRREAGQANNGTTTTTTTALKYSETIVGPKGSGSGAGMRVSGRKSIRGSRQPPTITDLSPITSTPPPPPAASGSSSAIPLDPDLSLAGNPAAGALALTEGRTTVTPGGGLNPEDSDDDEENSRPSQQQAIHQDQFKPISRKPTTTTLKTHRRRISAITFASNPLSFASPPGSILNLSRNRTRNQRGHSISSIATTNTVVSSDFSEHANQTLDSPTPSQLRGTGDLSNHHKNRGTNENIESVDQQSPSPFTTQPHLDDSETTKTDIYYSTEHDPDKRMSDMLFTYRPFDAKRSTQIVGRLELEPAPLLEADNEDDTGEEDIETDQTDTGTEQGEDDSSFNNEEITEDSGTLDDNMSVKSRRRKPIKPDPNSIENNNSISNSDQGNSLTNKILSDLLLVGSTIDSSNPLTRTNTQSPDVLSSANGNQTGTATKGLGNQSPPIVRRRERRRVNIKMGTLLGPPIIEEDSIIGPVADSDSAPPPRKSVAPLAIVPKFHRAISSVARPSLPDLRQVLPNPTGNTNSQEELSSQSSSTIINSFSPGRARALTTPTPIPSIEINPTVSKIRANDEASGGESVGQRTSFPRNRSGSGPIGISRIRRSLLQTGQPSSRPISSSGLTAAPTPPPLSNQEPKTVTTEPIITNTPSRKTKKKAQLSFKKIELQDPKLCKTIKPKSILTQLLTAQSASSSGDNPFKCFYALLASKERNSFKLSLYYPFSKLPKKPIKTSMKTDVCVEEVVGFALWNYVEENRLPKLNELDKSFESLDLFESFSWCLRLVEDDGEVDDDFPALDRIRPAAKVGSNEFAIVMATEAQAKQNQSAQSQIQRRPSRVLGDPKRAPRGSIEPSGTSATNNIPGGGGAASLLAPTMNTLMGNSGTIFDGVQRGVTSGSLLPGGYSSTPLGGSSFTGSTVYLKIRIPSPGKGVDSINTTLNVTMDMYLADVLESLVKKKSLGQVKDWALLVPSSPSIPVHQRDIVVPLDRTVQSLQGVNSLALVKRSQLSSKLLRNTQLNSNGNSNLYSTFQNTNPSASIFKRLSEIPQPKYVSITDLTSTSKTFIIQTKRRGILGKSDRLLTIEDDYVHISTINNNHHQQTLTNNTSSSSTTINNITPNIINPRTLTNNGTNIGSDNLTNNPSLNSIENSLNVNGKVSSYHISQIVDCLLRQANQNSALLRLVVLRDSGQKRYDVEAENYQSALEIIRHIKGLKEMYHSTRT
ncbi:hypothetical protein MJO28_013463 [Puccinia striiformis f. sp. tritici]|uniref:Uncharacterized protein n=1 Tax=Puccinia striiformis f. sp. tritici TaxID=168172 RepID=A0ACC0DYA6_9BASI|nr:hypothetical protein MJO28_013463 [Puccinia striiformis f. sp. tritici]